ncbi:MAG: alpha/beta fold hydrolase, partial [Alphaproteobacteria bacterium]|nr:alpha/beta fold hydrolase [Alphaproteobacteria bacterium]
AVGDWHGTITTPSGDLAVVVRIAHKDGALAGSLESVDQAPGELIPLTITKADDHELAFAVPSIGASYAGTWDERAGAWSGVWTQSNFKLPLVLKSGPGALAVKGMDGVWQAKVVRGDRSFRIVLRIVTRDGGTSIKFDAPDAGAGNLSVANFTRRGGLISFEVPTAGAKFEGELTADGNRMDGTWFFPNQPPTKIAWERTQTSAQQAPRPRPQLPKPPFPYRVEEVRVANAAANLTLACSLTLPQGPGPFAAAALFTGSGAQDRDETIFGHKPFAVIADHLTRNGMAVLRCDDRSVGGSTGEIEKATTLDFATDADAMVAFLASRPDIKANAIGLIGHSEGGLVACISGSANKRVAFLVLLAAPGTNMRQVMLSQRLLLGEAQGLPMKWLNDTQPLIARIFDAVAASAGGDDAMARVRAILTPDARAALHLTPASADVFAQQMTSPWMREFLRLDPKPYLNKITVPVLALAGSLDRQVAPDANLAALKAGLTHSRDVTTLEIDGLNHFFQHAKTGAFTEVVEIPETFSPGALQTMTAWLKRHTAH